MVAVAAIAAAVSAFLSLVAVSFVVWRFLREDRFGRLGRVADALGAYVVAAGHAVQGDQRAAREFPVLALALQSVIVSAPVDLGRCLRMATNYSDDPQAVVTSAEEGFLELAGAYDRLNRWPLPARAGGVRWVPPKSRK